MNGQEKEEQVIVTVENLEDGNVLVSMKEVKTDNIEQALLDEVLDDDLTATYLNTLNLNDFESMETIKIQLDEQQEKMMREALLAPFMD